MTPGTAGPEPSRLAPTTTDRGIRVVAGPMDREEFALEHRSVAPEADEGPAPAVVLVHGRGADEEDLLGLRTHLPDRLHVLSVRAPAPLGRGYTWYDLDLSGGGLHASQPDPEDFRRSLDALDAFVGRAVDAYELDPDRVGLFGFSQGAILSMTSVLERPDRYDWCVALHGYLPDTHDPATESVEGVEGFPVFLGTGTEDDVIPAERTERAAEALAAAGLDVTFETYPTGHGIGPDELDDAVRWVEARLDRPA